MGLGIFRRRKKSRDEDAELGDSETTRVPEPSTIKRPADLRRTPRLRPISPDRFSVLVDGAPVRVLNVSTGGVGLDVNSRTDWPPSGAVLSVRIIAGHDQAAAELEIVHRSGSSVGCRFVGDSTQAAALVAKHFDLELNATEMKPVNPMLLKEQADGTPEWYRSANGWEIYLVRSAAGVERFHMTFLGNYFEWKKGMDRAKYGTVVDEERESMLSYKRSALVRRSEDPEGMREQAARIVLNVGRLGTDVASRLVELLK